MTGPGAPSQSTRGVSATQVTVGGLASLTSVRSATLPGGDIGARAYFQKINSQGGVNGRTVNFVGVRDDGDDPSTNLAAAQTLLSQNGVFAIVPVITQQMGSAAFLQAHAVPAVGQLYDSASCIHTYLFAVNGCTSAPPGDRVYSPAVAQILRQGVFGGQADRSVAVTMDDDPAGHQSAEACSGPFRTAGFRVVLDNLYLPTATPITDYTPYVQQLMQADHGKPPDVIWTCNSFTTAIGLTAALKKAGYPGVLYNSVAYDPRVLQVPALRDALQGTYVYTSYQPIESDTAVMRQVRLDIKATDPAAQVSVEVLAGYFSAEMFSDILKKAGKKLTAGSFARAGNDNFTFDAGGALCPVTFPQGHAEGMVGGGLVKISGDQFSVVVPLSCQPMSANVHY